ncbi:MAG: NfeD family protein [Firmicutes bacterium]|nr:NfeD family protein [Bacillota bacterium]
MFIFTLFTSQVFWIVSWVVVFVAALVIEIAVPGLVSIWFCGGAVVSLLFAIFGIDPIFQLLAFVVVSGVLLFLTKVIFKKNIGIQPTTPTNTDALIGCDILIVSPCSKDYPGEGNIRDITWVVKTLDDVTFEKGEFAVIKAIKGNHIIIAKKEGK